LEISLHRNLIFAFPEGLLLLIDLTYDNADIQKIIAFENAFERLLQIVYDEGASDGDVIVQDCLQLMQNLLRENVSNQVCWREGVVRMPKVLSGLAHVFFSR
jgi:hypothetical protein